MKTSRRIVCVAILSVFLLATLAVAGPSKIDINQATTDELMELPRIGPVVAARIVAFREESGGFERIEELMNVRGVGAKTFERLRDQITVVAVKADNTTESDR